MINIINIFIGDKSNNKILAVLRSKKDNHFAGMWALPGGIIEEGESYFEAAKRELYEETNLELLYLSQKLILNSILKVYGLEVNVDIYKGYIEDFSQKKVESEDIEKIEWITPSELLNSMVAHEYPANEVKKFKVFLEKEGYMV